MPSNATAVKHSVHSAIFATSRTTFLLSIELAVDFAFEATVFATYRTAVFISVDAAIHGTKCSANLPAK
jgi:hypothetical protein